MQRMRSFPMSKCVCTQQIVCMILTNIDALLRNKQTVQTHLAYKLLEQHWYKSAAAGDKFCVFS